MAGSSVDTFLDLQLRLGLVPLVYPQGKKESIRPQVFPVILMKELE